MRSAAKRTSSMIHRHLSLGAPRVRTVHAALPGRAAVIALFPLSALFAFGCKAAPPEPEPAPKMRAEPAQEKSAEQTLEQQREARKRLGEAMGKRQEGKLGSEFPDRRHVAGSRMSKAAPDSGGPDPI